MEVRYDVAVVSGFISPLVRMSSDGANGYLIIPNSPGSLNSYWNFYKKIGGTFTQLSSFSVTGVSGDISVRMRIVESNIYFKIWSFGTTEPSAWTYSASDSSYSAAGYFGFYDNGVTSAGATSVADNVTLGDTILAAGTSSSSGITSSTVTVANTGATGGSQPYAYQWYRSTTSGFTPGSGNAVSGATSLTLNDTGLTSGTTYYYILGATDAASTTVYAAQLSVTTSSSALSNGTVSSSYVGATVATVTDSGATGGAGGYTYQWYRSTTSGFTPGSGNLISGATGLTLNDTGLSPSTTYYYRNTVTDAASNTATSSQLTVATNAALADGALSSGSVGTTTATVIDAGASGGSTPCAYQWYRSTTSGFTPGSGNALSGATGATLNDTGLSPSTTYYYKNIVTDNAGATSTSSQIAITTSSGPATIAVTNGALFWSPGNWDLLNIGTFGVSVATMQATAPGAYLKFIVTGTVNLTIGIDNSTTSGFPSGEMPTVCWSINGAPFTAVQLAPSQTSLGLSSSLSTGTTYAVEIYLQDSSQVNGYADVWGSSGVSPTNVLRINGITIDSAGSVSAATLRPKRSLHFGDSISAGYHVIASGADDATQSFVPLLAQAFNAEFGQVAYGGQGWTVAGGSNAAPFITAYNLYSVGRSRSLTGLNYVFIHHGTNDARSSVGGSTIQSEGQAMLASLRSACGSATIIFVVTPPSGCYDSNLIAAVTAYRSSSGDPNVYAIDATSLVPQGDFGLTFGGATQWTYDGVHPLIYAHARLGAAYAALSQTALGGSSSYSRTRIMNG